MNTSLAIVFVASLAATLNPTLLTAVIVMFLLPHRNGSCSSGTVS